MRGLLLLLVANMIGMIESDYDGLLYAIDTTTIVVIDEASTKIITLTPETKIIDRESKPTTLEQILKRCNRSPNEGLLPIHIYLKHEKATKILINGRL